MIKETLTLKQFIESKREQLVFSCSSKEETYKLHDSICTWLIRHKLNKDIKVAINTKNNNYYLCVSKDSDFRVNLRNENRPDYAREINEFLASKKELTVLNYTEEKIDSASVAIRKYISKNGIKNIKVTRCKNNIILKKIELEVECG